MHRHIRFAFAAADVQHALGEGFQVLQIEPDLFGHPGRRYACSGTQPGEHELERSGAGVGPFVMRQLVRTDHREVADIDIVDAPTQPPASRANDAYVIRTIHPQPFATTNFIGYCCRLTAPFFVTRVSAPTCSPICSSGVIGFGWTTIAMSSANDRPAGTGLESVQYSQQDWSISGGWMSTP